MFWSLNDLNDVVICAHNVYDSLVKVGHFEVINEETGEIRVLKVIADAHVEHDLFYVIAFGHYQGCYKMKNRRGDKTNTNSTVDDRERRNLLNCSYCKPNKGENAKNCRKHGRTKPKYKNKRK